MPKYEYHCKTCQQNFVIQAGMNEARSNILCSACQSTEVFRIFAGIMTQGDKQRSDVPAVPMPGNASTHQRCGCAPNLSHCH